MIIGKILLGLLIFAIGLLACSLVFILMIFIGNVIESLITNLKKYKTFRRIFKITSWITKIILSLLRIAFVILMAYGIGDTLF